MAINSGWVRRFMDIEYPDSCNPFFNGVHGIRHVVNHYWGGGGVYEFLQLSLIEELEHDSQISGYFTMGVLTYISCTGISISAVRSI